MGRSIDVFVFAVALLFLIIAVVLTPLGGNSNNVLTGFTFSTVYTGYAVPISSVVVNNNLSFASSSDSAIRTLDVSDDIIYRLGYVSYDSQSWTPFNITPSGTQSGEWIYTRGAAGLTFTPSNLHLNNSRNSSNNTYIIVYTCSKNTTIHNWSCHDGWQIITFDARLNSGNSSSTFAWTNELMINGGFEQGNLNGWTAVNGVTKGWNVTSSMNWNSVNVASQSGTYQAYNLGGGNGITLDFYLYQDVSLASYANYIDVGTAVINASGWGVSSEYYAGADNTRIQIMFLDSARNNISTVLDTGYISNRTWWQAKISNYPIPANARYIRMWGNTYEDCSWQGIFCDSGSLDSFSVKVGYGGTQITPPPCTSVCSLNAKHCSGTSGYQTCSDINNDGCYEWGSVVSCPTGQTCSGAGVCSAPTTTCSDDCTSGTKVCSGSGYLTCGNYDSDSCLDWSTTATSCPSGQVCSGAGNCGTFTGTIHYIDAAGSDAASRGTASAPWKTLSYACSQVKTSGDIIHVNAGTYTETQTCALAVGVSIEGEGASSMIKSHVTGEYNYLVSLSSGSEGTNGNQHISGILFDGDNLIGSNAIIVNARSNVKIYSCTFQNFEKSGVVFNGGVGWLDGSPKIWATGDEFHDNVMNNCANYIASNDNGQGCLQVGATEGMLVYNNVITQNQRGAGLNGWPIKFYDYGYNKGWKIYNNVLVGTPIQGSPPAYAWGFAIESWNSLGGFEIYNNTIKGALDICEPIKGTYSFGIIIHDNVIGFDTMTPALNGEGDVGIRLEESGEYINISNNRFKYNAAAIYTSSTSGQTFNNVNIYYNIFENIGADKNSKGWGLRQTADDNTNIYSNWNIYNNVIIANPSGSTTYGIQIPAGKDSNINIRNNIIENFDSQPIYGSSSVSGLSIENNIFYQNGNNNPTYSGTATVQNNYPGINPSFVSSTNYHLNAGSPAIDKGINVGLTKDYEGKPVGNPPDIGAYEYP